MCGKKKQTNNHNISGTEKHLKPGASYSRPKKELTESLRSRNGVRNDSRIVGQETQNENQETKEQTHRDFCPQWRKCGGCQLQNMPYSRQLRWKQAQVEKLLGRFCAVSPIIGMETPFHYRNKVQAAFGTNRYGQTVSGVYQSSTHTIVPVNTCMTEDQIADKIIVSIRKLLGEFKLQPYDERTRKGFLRHVLVKRGFSSGQVMVALVTGSPVFPAKNAFVKTLLSKHPEITTLIQNVNNQFTSLVLGRDEKILYGPGYIEDTLCGCIFRISAKSFYQINPVQTEILYRKALEFAQLNGTQTVLDAYCGVGTIGLIASRHAAQVVGVEVNADAVRDAIANAKRNDIQNIWFREADASNFVMDMAKAGECADIVLMDPPRAGSDRRFLTALTAMGAKKIVYISCNPETQQRDVLFLVGQGYQVKAIQPVDMFPHTNHVETCVLLSHKNS